MASKNPIKKLLIVDDSAVERKLICGLLRKQWPNYTILEAEDGEAGLSSIEQWMPDVVLTDMCMPRTGGLELLQALREKQSVIPVVVISGMGNEQSAVAALQAGAASYIPKSNLPELLISTLNTVLELATTHSNRRRIIGCLTSMDLRFELENDDSLVPPLVRYLEDQVGSLRLCDEHELVRIGVALHESLTNAIHHGNLELDSELRQGETSIYYDLAETRRLQWPYCHRRVHFFASLNGERLRFVIRDEGPGFNREALRDPTEEENIFRIGGRGLLLIRSFMDEVLFNRRGNEITLVKYTSAGRKLLAEMNEACLEDASSAIESDTEVGLLDEEPTEILAAV